MKKFLLIFLGSIFIELGIIERANSVTLGYGAGDFAGIKGVSYTYVDNPFDFSLSLKGSNISNVSGSASVTNTFFGKYWSIITTVNTIDTKDEDFISVGWVVTHNLVPHPKDGVGRPYQNSLDTSPSQSIRGFGSQFSNDVEDHGRHSDVFGSQLSIELSPVNFLEISGWTWNINGKHLPVPLKGL